MTGQINTYEIRQVTSISDLLDKLRVDIVAEQVHWFRGQKKADWPLLPTLARKTRDLEKEADLVAKFKQNASLLLSSSLPRSEWDWLTIMQHHGVPTRLLDWTENPLVGLYFAAESFRNFDGALWILRPVELNGVSQISPDYPQYIPNFEDDAVSSYKPSVLEREKVSRLKPIAVIGPRNTPRMQAQLGAFTVVHRDPIPIESVGDGRHIIKYQVPSAAKETIRRELKLIGISKFQLFPELQSLGDILKI